MIQHCKGFQALCVLPITNHVIIIEPWGQSLFHAFVDPFLKEKWSSRCEDLRLSHLVFQTVDSYAQHKLDSSIDVKCGKLYGTSNFTKARFKFFNMIHDLERMQLMHDGNWSTRRVLGVSHGYVLFDPGGTSLEACLISFKKFRALNYINHCELQGEIWQAKILGLYFPSSAACY